MKVEEGQRSGTTEERRRDPQEKFGDVVRKTSPAPASGAPKKRAASQDRPPLPTAGVIARPVHAEVRASSLRVTSETLGRARAGAHAEVDRLAGVRTELNQSREEKLEHRALDLIRRELEQPSTGGPRERPAEPPGPERVTHPAEATSRVGPGEGAASGAESMLQGSKSGAPSVNATSAIELIERIDVFVRSGRPGLTLQLAPGSFAGKAELVRSGPGEVAVTLEGGRGPLSLADVQKLQDELATRGIRLGAVRWRGGAQGR